MLLIASSVLYIYVSELKGYVHRNERPDLYSVEHEGVQVVPPTIAYFRENGVFVAGVRLPTLKYDCEGRAFIKVGVERIYFYLKKKTDVYREFESHEKFKSFLEISNLSFDHVAADLRVNYLIDNYSSLHKEVETANCELL